jgi:hypothetical protein
MTLKPIKIKTTLVQADLEEELQMRAELQLNRISKLNYSPKEISWKVMIMFSVLAAQTFSLPNSSGRL